METSKEGTNAVVIGAGIVGVCTAFELSKSGYAVTVIERFPLPGQFCSMGNAGVFTEEKAPPFKSVAPKYEFSPLMWEAFKSLSPTFKPNYSSYALVDPYFFAEFTSHKWLYAFFKSNFQKKKNKYLSDYFDKFCENAFLSNAAQVRKNIDHNFLSNTTHAKIIPSSISNIKNHKNLYTKLIPIQSKQCESETTLSHTQKHIDDITVEINPNAYASDCHAFCNSICGIPSYQTNKINFRFNTEAKQILVDKENNVCGVEIDNNDNNTIIKADKIVICAGVLTNNIIQNKVYQINGDNIMDRKKVKLPYIPIVPLQGFSISVPYSPNSKYKYPFASVCYFPSRIYASRINDKILRFSAYGYFRNTGYAAKAWKNMQNAIEPRQGIQSNIYNPTKLENALLDNLENCVKDNLLSLYDIDEEYFEENKIRWTGFRPYTPDGLPFVDQIKRVNGLYVNAGHGSLGWGTSHGTAKLLVNLIDKLPVADENQNNVLKLLSIDRF